jgi:hypothetical protein
MVHIKFLILKVLWEIPSMLLCLFAEDHVRFHYKAGDIYGGERGPGLGFLQVPTASLPVNILPVLHMYHSTEAQGLVEEIHFVTITE